MFMIFFNIAAMFIAYTDFFPNTLYGDTLGVGEPADMKTAESVFTTLSGGATLFGYELSFAVIMGGLILFSVGVGIFSKSGVIGLAMGLIGFLFVTMWTNSKQALDSITANMDSSVSYLILMVGVGILIMFVITLMDYAAGQRSAGD